MTSRGSKHWSSGAMPLVAPDVLGPIVAASADLAMVITDLGQVQSVLSSPDDLDPVAIRDWEGRDLRACLTTESVDKFETRLGEMAADPERTWPSMELNHTGLGAGDLPVRYSFHAVGPDGAILCLGRDLRPISEIQQQLVAAQIALERDYEHQRETATRLRVLMETSRDAIVFVALSSGRITEANGAAAHLLGTGIDQLVGLRLSEELATPDGAAWDLEALVEAAREDDPGPLDLLTRRGKRRVRIRGTLFRAAGERMMLCRLHRAERVAAEESDTAARMTKLFDRGADAIAFTDRAGNLTAANDAFLDLVESEDMSALRGRPLSDHLSRGQVDLKVMTDHASRNGQMPIYATRLRGTFGGSTAVEIATTYLNDPNRPAFAFVLRDAGRLETARGGTPAPGLGDEGARSARELVGAATLKDIVSETTDVIERMCIETAVELTGNNRVAAAEMLGLSRQSLYVKLRKYDLLARGD